MWFIYIYIYIYMKLYIWFHYWEGNKSCDTVSIFHMDMQFFHHWNNTALLLAICLFNWVHFGALLSCLFICLLFTNNIVFWLSYLYSNSWSSGISFSMFCSYLMLFLKFWIFCLSIIILEFVNIYKVTW
jgi:hypothetical protein